MTGVCCFCEEVTALATLPAALKIDERIFEAALSFASPLAGVPVVGAVLPGDPLAEPLAEAAVDNDDDAVGDEGVLERAACAFFKKESKLSPRILASSFFISFSSERRSEPNIIVSLKMSYAVFIC